ncbi:ATP-binding response regulator [Shewanella colwelliana]|uniref:ATP-binding response regulator n=1 Tax=Shewanella colwelliana TaxID=23 RepID=UPI003736DFB1
MKSCNLVCIFLISGLFITLFINSLLWNYFNSDFFKQHQNKVETTFNSSKEMMLQHQIMLDAIKAFFNSSSEVTKAEFSSFSKDLLKIKSSIALTLTPELTLSFISDPTFIDLVSDGLENIQEWEVNKFVLDNFETITTPIDDPKMPYLIYAISYKRIQQKINLNSDVCEHFTLNGNKLDSIGCSGIKQNRFYETFSYHTEQTFHLKKYNLIYTSSVETVPSERVILEILVLIFLINALVVLCLFALFYIVKTKINADREKTEIDSKFALLSTLNHEIRTPINAVLGYTNMLKNIKSDNNEEQVILNKIVWAVNLLNSVAQNTLTYSKAAVGPLIINYETVDLKSFFHSIEDYYQSFVTIHQKKLIIKADDLPQDVLSLDATKLFQLLTNFINNAFKYSSGDTVLVRVSIKPNKLNHMDNDKFDGFIKVAIRDFGQGMSSEGKLALSKPFTIDSKDANASKSGIGIGLYTCKKVIESIGGSIRIRSQLGIGTLVLFKFPFKYLTMKTELKDMPNSSASGGNIINNEENKINSNNQNAGKIVILVDDNLFNLEVCKTMLETAGFPVYTAEDKEGLFKLLESLNIKPKPQCNQEDIEIIVLMDYMLTDTDGLTLIRMMRERGYGQIKYFILSANSKDEIPNSEFLQCVDFLQKPLDLTILESRLNL